MKKCKSKILVIVLLIILLLSILQINSLATNSNILIIQQNENQYMIYIESMINQEFEFAFSNSKEETNLNYIAFAEDTSGNNVAYVDSELKDSYFGTEDTYLWVKTSEGIVINGEKITLNDSKTIEELNQIMDLTKRITVESTAEEEKIKINGKQDETYYYQFCVVNSSEEYTRLMNLVNKMSEFDENTNVFLKLQTHNELNELYKSLYSKLNNKDWVKAENLEITKPYGATENQQYVLWLKDGNENVDVQFLTAYEKTVTTVSEKANIKQVTSQLPYTFDETTTLFIILGAVTIAIIVILAYKKVNKNARKA